MTEERDALLFSDGSLTIFNKNRSMRMIHEERNQADINAKPEDLTKIVRVAFEIVGIIDDTSFPISKSGTKG